MIAEYNLIRSADGRGNFARVRVSARPAPFVRVENCLATEPDRRKGESTHADWVEAALGGAVRCANAMVRAGLAEGCHVELLQIIGAVIDTNPATVECASAQAVWKAMFPDKQELEMIYVENAWQVCLP